MPEEDREFHKQEVAIEEAVDSLDKKELELRILMRGARIAEAIEDLSTMHQILADPDETTRLERLKLEQDQKELPQLQEQLKLDMEQLERLRHREELQRSRDREDRKPWWKRILR